MVEEENIKPFPCLPTAFENRKYSDLKLPLHSPTETFLSIANTTKVARRAITLLALKNRF